MSETFKFIRGKTSDDYIIGSDKRSNAIVAAFDAGDSSEDLSLDTKNDTTFQDRVAALAPEKKITIFTRKLDDINFKIIPEKVENTFTNMTAEVASVSSDSDSGSTISEGCTKELMAAAKKLTYTATAEGGVNWNIGTGESETPITVRSGNHSKTMQAKFYAEGNVSKRPYAIANGTDLTNVMNGIPQSVNTKGSNDYASDYFSNGTRYKEAETYTVEDTSNLLVTASSGSVRPAVTYRVNNGYVITTLSGNAAQAGTTLNWNTTKEKSICVYRKHNANGPFAGGAHTMDASRVGDISGNYSISFTFANTFEKGRTLSFTNPDHNFNTGSNNTVALKPSNDTTASYFGGSGWLSTSLTASKDIPAGTHVSFTLSSSYYGYRVTITATPLAQYSKTATLTIEEIDGTKVYPGLYVPNECYIISENEESGPTLVEAIIDNVSAETKCYKMPGEYEIFETGLYVPTGDPNTYYKWTGNANEEKISSSNVSVTGNVFSPKNGDSPRVDITNLTLKAESVS